VVQSLLGGRLYHCNYCRIQFYDLRHTMKVSPNRNEPTPGPASVSGPEKIAS
jgi:hypothetical protein